MECKWIKQKNRRAHKTKELIDTLWNVNKSIKCAVSGSVLELIDTLWDVN